MRAARPLVIILIAAVLAGCVLDTAPGASHLAGGFDASRAATRAPRETPATENFAKVGPDLFRGGGPSDNDMKLLYNMGVRTDISLQMNTGAEGAIVAHEREVARSLNMNFIKLPLPFRREPPKAMVDQFLAVFKQARILPAYVHCKHGRDRTGTMVGIFRITHDGWTGAKALEEMKSFGFKPKDYPEYASFVLNYKPGQAARKPAKKAGRREDEGTGEDLGFVDFPYMGEADGPPECPEEAS